MKMDRNVNADGFDRYGLIKLRKLTRAKLKKLVAWALQNSCLDALYFGDRDRQIKSAFRMSNLGRAKQDSDFFVLMLDDEFAAPALNEYSNAVRVRASSCDRWLSLDQPCGCKLKAVNKANDDVELADWGKRCKAVNCVRVVGQVDPKFEGPQVELREFASEVSTLAQKAEKMYADGKSHHPAPLIHLG